MLRDKGLDFEVARLLKIEDRLNLRHERKSWAQWCDFTDRIDAAKNPLQSHHRQIYLSPRQLRLNH